jgi:hypothetical protein
MFFILKLILALTIFFVGFGIWRTWQMEHSEYQVRFAAGTAPTPALEGPYPGRVPGHVFAWQGKKFNAGDTGINVFNAKDGQYERYPFVTSVDAGVRTHNPVLKIDYNIPENPWWLKPVLDEVVQVAPDFYIGKMHLRIIPGYPFTVAFFELKK